MKLLGNLLDRKNQATRKPYGHPVPSAVEDFITSVDAIIHEWRDYSRRYNSNGIPIDEYSDSQKELNKDKKWKTFFIHVFGESNPDAIEHFPVTEKIASKWTDEVKLVFFSVLEPGKHIPPHKGNNYGVIRTQIGIEITSPEKTGLRVADCTVQLRTRETFTFDDTFEHEAWNFSDSDRIVLIIDSCKKLPYIYDLLNRYYLKKLKSTEYVQSVLRKFRTSIKE